MPARRNMKKWAALLTAGGSLTVLDTCNPEVRDTVLGGVESVSTGLAATLIQAFFQGLAIDEDAPGVVFAPQIHGEFEQLWDKPVFI
ncbi:MAG: hypothetical protein AB7N71_04980 [Phycisphaerae bacterium]